MSYGITIWSNIPVDLTALSSVDKRWVIGNGHACYDGRGWQISVSQSLKVLLEDVPEAVASALPGIEFLTEVILEPISAPPSAFSILNKSTRQIANVVGGIIEDPQLEKITLPKGVKRFVPKERIREARFSQIEMSWWFTESPLLTEEGFIKFFQYLKRNLPEALPRRYGLWEPPQHKLVECGEAHFLQFFEEHRSDM